MIFAPQEVAACSPALNSASTNQRISQYGRLYVAWNVKKRGEYN